MNIWTQFSLQDFNSFQVFTTSKYFAEVNTETDVKRLIQQPIWLKEAKLIMGEGSNILFTKPFDGLIIHNKCKGIELINENDTAVWIKVNGGEIWHKLVQYTIENNWFGIENLSLIPGSVGAAPIQNIGAYGVELKDTLVSLEAIELATGKIKTFSKKACQFGYRDSLFKRKAKGKYFILNLTLQLSKQPVYHLDYGAIKQELTKQGYFDTQQLTSKMISQAICAIRTRKLPNPRLLGNGGSFFKNPILSLATFNTLQILYPTMPYYSLPNKQVKIPAAWLIDQCGWKGYRKGDAGVHKQHALVLVNYGKATGEEIYVLAKQIQESVSQRFQIALETEVNII